MTNDDLKIIRQRLGWSRAEMARRHGADLSIIESWESGDAQPDAAALNHYHFLRNGVDEAADQIARTPAAESRLESDGLAQVAQRELLNEG